MGTAAGVEIGTRTATALVDGPSRPTLLASGVRDVPVERDIDGSLTASGAAGAAVAGFAGQLGQPEPIVVDGTPYGVEALLAVVIGAGLADVGGAPLVALAHADGLDEYRRWLLIASARLAGVPVGAVELVGAAEALEALAGSGLEVAEELAVATGAALVALQRRPVTPAGGSAGGLGPAAAGAAGAGAATAGVVGGAGTAAMVTGSGGEVGAVGPAGVVPHLGAGAESMARLKLEMQGASPAGVPHLGAGAESVARLKLWMLGAATAATVTAVSIGYLAARGGDDEITSPPAPTAVIAPPATTDPGAQSPPTTPDAVTATPITTVAPTATDAPIATDTVPAEECIVGTWIVDNAAFAALATAIIAAEGGTVGVTSGQIVVDVHPDGTFQVDSDGFSVEVTVDVGAAHMVWSGGDSGVWSANADGTFTIEPTAVGTTIVIDVTAEGGSFSIPVPSDAGTLPGAHVAECSGDSLNLISNTGDLGHIPLVRG